MEVDLRFTQFSIIREPQRPKRKKRTKIVVTASYWQDKGKKFLYHMSKAADSASTQDSSHGRPYFTGFAATNHGTRILCNLLV